MAKLFEILLFGGFQLQDYRDETRRFIELQPREELLLARLAIAGGWVTHAELAKAAAGGELKGADRKDINKRIQEYVSTLNRKIFGKNARDHFCHLSNGSRRLNHDLIEVDTTKFYSAIHTDKPQVGLQALEDYEKGFLPSYEESEIKWISEERTRIIQTYPQVLVQTLDNLLDAGNVKESLRWLEVLKNLQGQHFVIEYERLGEKLEKIRHEQQKERQSTKRQRLLSGTENSYSLSSSFSLSHQLPPISGFKVRHQQLHRLMAHQPEQGALVVGLFGMPGVGKTTLALALANEWKERFPDAQLRFDGQGHKVSAPSPVALIQTVIRTLCPSVTLQLDQDEEISLIKLQGIYYGLLADKRALIFVDNAFDASQIRSLVPPDGSALIFTSRLQIVVGSTAPEMIPPLSQSESISLLKKLCPSLSEGEARELARLCAGLPLALDIVAMHLKLNFDLWGSTLATSYISQLSSKLLETLNQGSIERGNESVSEILQLSEECISPAERQAWYSLSVFPAAFDPMVAYSVCNVDENTLNSLLKRSLLMVEGPHYRLHDIIRDFAAMRLDEDPIYAYEVRYRHALYYRNILEKSNFLFLKGAEGVTEGLRLFDIHWKNIQAGQKWSSFYTDINEDAARLALQYVRVGSAILSLRLHPAIQLDWLRDALKAAQNIIYLTDEDKKSKAAVLHNIGLAHSNLGQMRIAITYYKQSLVMLEELQLYYEKIICLINCGWAYSQIKRRKTAFQQYYHALEILNLVSNPQKRDAAKINVLGNLGIAYKNIGKRNEAMALHQEALIIAQRVGDWRMEAYQLGSIGVILDIEGEYDSAIRFYTKQRIISHRIGDKRGWGKAIFNTAICRYNQDKIDLAIRLAEKGHAIFQSIGDPEATNAEKHLRKWRSKREVEV